MLRTKSLLLVSLLSFFGLLSCSGVGKQAKESNAMEIYYVARIDNQTVELKSQEALKHPPKLTLINRTTNHLEHLTLKDQPAKLIYHFSLPTSMAAINEHIEAQVSVEGKEQTLPLRYFKFYDHQDFVSQYIPTEETPWGVTLSSDSSTFRVWSPTASIVNLNLYPTGHNSAIKESHAMQALPKGVWELTLPRNLEGLYYTYAVTNAGVAYEVTDPYAISTGINGLRALITTSDTVLGDLTFDDNYLQVAPVDAIIYELHVRDVSMSPTTNHPDELRGKFLGVVEPDTTNSYNQTTGFDHIRDLGVSHVHFLPIYDYNSVDEARLEDNVFNWGYDPLNYNVPEGSYSSDPADGYVRVRELRQMVAALHKADIGVVMDVVYNHTGPVNDHFLERLVPDYYFRMNDFGQLANGSGTGNETDSRRIMFRRYMIDSLRHLATTYKIDGFRFDLMAVHDIETMNLIADALMAINPNVLLYGEGWHAGGSPLDPKLAALKDNTAQMPHIAVFNDDIRDGLKGWVFDAKERGFVNGNPDVYDRAVFGFLGSMVDSPEGGFKAYAKRPTDTISYVSAHDNHTLFDRFTQSVPAQSWQEYMRMQIMANAMVLTAPGIPFLHAGVEMMRTKNGDENSYKSPDAINQLNYDRKNDALPVFRYYQNLIALRRKHPIFKQGLLADDQHAFKMVAGSQEDPLFMAFHVQANATDDPWQAMYLIFNAGENTHTINLNAGEWQLFADTWQVYPDVAPKTFTQSVDVQPKSIMMLYQQR